MFAIEVLTVWFGFVPFGNLLQFLAINFFLFRFDI